jgi:hypothetical protein
VRILKPRFELDLREMNQSETSEVEALAQEVGAYQEWETTTDGLKAVRLEFESPDDYVEFVRRMPLGTWEVSE